MNDKTRDDIKLAVSIKKHLNSKYVKLQISGIQIKCDTIGGGSLRKCHQMTQGRGGPFQSVT